MNEVIAAKLAERAIRDAKLAPSAAARVKGYNAYCATALFAGDVETYAIDLNKFFNMCDKTIDRYVKLMQALATGAFYLNNENDQNRFAFNAIRSMVNAHNVKVAQLTRDDTFAIGQKVETANDYVAVSSRIMADSTVARQVGIALTCLEVLNMCEVQRVGSKVVGYKINDKSPMFKRLAKMVKAENASQN